MEVEEKTKLEERERMNETAADSSVKVFNNKSRFGGDSPLRRNTEEHFISGATKSSGNSDEINSGADGNRTKWTPGEFNAGPSIPDIYPETLAFLIAKTPLFLGFYMVTVVWNDEQVAAAIQKFGEAQSIVPQNFLLKMKPMATQSNPQTKLIILTSFPRLLLRP